jgi:rhamnosyltransferase
MNKEMRVCAVVVTYMPAPDVGENITLLQQQVDGVVIVDNSIGSAGRKRLARFDEGLNTKVIYNGKNGGLAAALNTGVKYARQLGYEWIATFDQDSRVTDGMLKTMIQNYDSHPGRERIGIVAPSYREKATGRLSLYAEKATSDQSGPWMFQLSVITSGSLVKANVFDVVGYYNEELFIDYIDHDFCFRCVDAGFSILGCRNAVLDHQYGHQTRHKILWREVITTNHNAVRRYYIARNSVYVYKKYIFKYPSWIARDAWVSIQNIFKVAVLEADRKSKLFNMARGFVDGVVGKLGKL